MVSLSTLTWYNIFVRDLVFKFAPRPDKWKRFRHRKLST